MSIRDKIEKIARETAWETASSLMATRVAATTNNSEQSGEITSIDDQVAKVRMPDGSEVSVTLLGNRYVGVGDTLVVTANLFGM